jgi:hypothetical protein
MLKMEFDGYKTSNVHFKCNYMTILTTSLLIVVVVAIVVIVCELLFID